MAAMVMVMVANPVTERRISPALRKPVDGSLQKHRTSRRFIVCEHILDNQQVQRQRYLHGACVH